MSTLNPANQMKQSQLGHLSEGAGADIAVLRVDHGRFGLVDAQGSRFDATKLLECELTLRNGEVLWDLNGRTKPDWREYWGKL